MAKSRFAVLIGMTLIVGILAGVAGTRAADTLPVKRTMLIQTPLVENGSGERHAQMYITEAAPGVTLGKHFHHAHTFVYVLQGAITIEEEGKPAMTFGPGQAFHEPPMFRHDARSGATTPLKILVFQAPLKGQPLAEAVK